MRFGLGSYALAWSIGVPGHIPQKPVKALELIHFADSANLSIVQFDDNIPLHRLKNTELDEVIAFAKRCNVDIEVGTKKLTVQNAKRYLEIARRCQSPFLRMVIDDRNYHPGHNEILRVLESVIQDFEDGDVILAIENHDRFKAQEFKKMIDYIASRHLRICLDSVNSFGAGEGIETILNTLAPFTVNLHLKDFIIQRAWHNMGFVIEGRPLGAGMLPIRKLINEVSESCISATLELWLSPEKDLESTIRKEREWVEESIAYWKENFIRQE